jgi:hypothetical protein
MIEIMGQKGFPAVGSLFSDSLLGPVPERGKRNIRIPGPLLGSYLSSWLEIFHATAFPQLLFRDLFHKGLALS